MTSRPGQGATFSIALPLAPEAVPVTGDHDEEPGEQPANPDYIDFGPHDGELGERQRWLSPHARSAARAAVRAPSR